MNDITTPSVVPAQGENPVRPAINAEASATFKITDTKLYIPVNYSFSSKVSQIIRATKKRFKRTIKWNKYRSEMSNQNKNNNLNYVIDQTFIEANKLFVLSFENEDDRISFSKYYYKLNLEIKDFNVLIDGKSFFDSPIKAKEETYEKIIEIGRNID